MPATTPSHTAWRNALFVLMSSAGLAVAALMSRMPSLRDHLGVEASGIGLMLAFFSLGSLTGLAFSGLLLRRLGALGLIRYGAPVFGIGLAAIGVSAGVFGSFPVTAAVSFVFGAMIALSDVGTNVEGAANERAAGRSVMPFLHAGFSLGTVVGAALGALAAQFAVPIVWHFAVVGALVVLAAVTAPSWIPRVADDEAPSDAPRVKTRSVWREPRTLLLGVVVFAFAYIEGAANDWLTLGLVDERGLDQAQAAIMLAVFMSAMTAGRFVGSRFVDRVGRVAALISSGILAGAGLALVVFVPELWAVIVGTIAWGVGSCLGFPVGMSAAGDDPVRGPQRVAAVSVIGYAAFFAGPPAIGFLADQFGILPSLSVILVLVALAIAASPAARERRRGEPGIAPSAVGADPAAATPE